MECLGNMLFRVEFEDSSLICHLSGKMKVHNVKVSVGDKVLVVIDPLGGKTTNRITRRL